MTVKELKKWLENFVDWADVEYSVAKGKVTLNVTLAGNPLGATLELDKEG